MIISLLLMLNFRVYQQEIKKSLIGKLFVHNDLLLVNLI